MAQDFDSIDQSLGGDPSHRGDVTLDVTLSEAASSEGGKFLERDSAQSYLPTLPSADSECVSPDGGIEVAHWSNH